MILSTRQKAGRSVELHSFTEGGHGFGICDQGTTSDLWKYQIVFWMSQKK